jgi:beta-mannosidase
MRPYQTYGDIGGRFNSEFGMEASAHLSTVKQYVTNSDEMYPQSLTMDFHNKADGHERRITSYLQENFKTSSSSLKVSQ